MEIIKLLLALLIQASFLAVECLNIPADSILDHLLPSYDYIVVGGGVSGLVVANRLTENPNVTVLVFEAGELDSSPEAVTVPGLIGHGGFVPPYNWNLTTTPQEFLDNRSRDYGQGHVVGGGSILNGLVMTRGAKAEYDAWETLGNPGWSWRGLLPYFKKSENFSAVVSPEYQNTLHIHPHMSVHGTDGPVGVGYPSFFYNQSTKFLRGIHELGVPVLSDPNAGVAAGATIVPSSILAWNQSRADGRRSYLDPVLDRPNLHLATQQTVTRILFVNETSTGQSPFEALRRAYAVEFVTLGDLHRWQVPCGKEVILAAGSVLSPALLQVSGVGPASVLEDLQVPVVLEIPGVGQNFQDHGMVQAFYNYTEPGLFSANNLTGDTLLNVQEQYLANHTGPWTQPLISTVAFISLFNLSRLLDHAPNPSVIGSNFDHKAALRLGPDAHPTIVEGYAHQLRALLSLVLNPAVAVLEIMADSIGTLSVVMQHPLSRGTVRALSSDLLSGGSVAPNIHLDPRYCSHDLDCEFLRYGLKLNDRIIKTKHMKELKPAPAYPWNDACNDTLLTETIKARIQTEFHPVGTTAMMPLAHGGVVSPRLVVYGTANLRVVDAGIIPILPAAHIQSAVFAIAEKAADLIKEDYDTFQPPTPAPNSIPLGPGDPHTPSGSPEPQG
ncbi:putative GMC oxidoreductase [Podospora australis]|uniref:GMC oxidoreductase n=1 Tax=Podospora australis TaxID=1536484 RepID=A0AAN6X2H0_9PEZI|nr:putative GMC oxidoreductase [Podospora australis]